MIMTKEKAPETAATVTSAQNCLSHLNSSTDTSLCKEDLSIRQQILTNLISQSLTQDFDLASVNVFDSNRLDIRLGEGLSFIRQIVLSDGRVVYNIDYDGQSVTPTQIVETFKSFGANQGPKYTEEQIIKILDSIISEHEKPEK